MGLLWGSYTLMFWGWTMVKGYSITLPQIVMPGDYKGTWPPSAATASTVSSSSTPAAAPTGVAGAVATGTAGVNAGVSSAAGSGNPIGTILQGLGF